MADSSMRFPVPGRRLSRLRLAAGLVFAAVCLARDSRGAEPWTFEGAIRHALSNSPDARVAQKRIGTAQAGLEQANAALWPTVQLQSSYTGSDDPTSVFMWALKQSSFSLTAFDFNNPPAADNFNARGVATLPLYTGGRISSSRQAARAQVAAAEQNAAAVRNTLAFETARTFHSVQKTRAFIQATEAAVRSHETNLALAQRRLGAGTLLKAEVLDVEVRLAQAREDLVRARNANALAERALRNLLGLEQGAFSVGEAAPDVAAPTSTDPSARPELAAIRQMEAAVAAERRAAQSGYYPRVSAFGSVDYDHGWKFNNEGESFTAGALLQWDIWDGRLTRAKVSEAQSRLEAVQEEERKLRLALGLEVEQASLNLNEAMERLKVTEKAVAQATESVQLTRARFEQGLALSTQLLDAETALTAARVRRAEAEAGRRIAVAAYRKALGSPQYDETPNRP